MARDILGANGISDEYPVIRHMLNGEAVTGIAAYNPPMSAQAEREATAKREKEAAKK